MVQQQRPNGPSVFFDQDVPKEKQFAFILFQMILLQFMVLVIACNSYCFSQTQDPTWTPQPNIAASLHGIDLPKRGPLTFELNDISKKGQLFQPTMLSSNNSQMCVQIQVFVTCSSQNLVYPGTWNFDFCSNPCTWVHKVQNFCLEKKILQGEFSEIYCFLKLNNQ